MEIHTLDLGFQGFPQAIAAYLVVGPEGPVLVETGPGSTLPALEKALGEHGFAPHDIRHLLVTHIHLDHAGAAGWWAQQGARIYVHHFGAKHLVDPSRLISSARRIYGDRMEPLWGEILPAPEENVIPVSDGEEIWVCGMTFKALATPGHALHHHVYQLGEVAFTGDAAGIALPGATFVDLPAPPPEFDLERWQETVQRIRMERFSTIYPTHFGPVRKVLSHLQTLEPLLQEAAQTVLDRMEAGDSFDQMVKHYTDWNRRRALQAGVSEEEFRRYKTVNPLHMSVSGIQRYWKRKES